jgi:flagellar FliJ protein
MSAIESLLYLKRWNEEQAKQQFAIFLKELAAEEKRLLGLEEQFKNAGRKFDAASNELIEIDELRRLSRYLELLVDRIRHQKDVIVLKELQVEEARKALQEASKEKKTFEKLDEKQKDLLTREVKRKEQIRTDETAVIRHARKTGDRQ